MFRNFSELADFNVEAVLDVLWLAASKGHISRVEVLGRWAYDRVDHRGRWRDALGKCLGGREADPHLGWTEIHPAYLVRILE